MLKQVGCLFDHCNLLVYWFFFDKAVGSLVSATTIAAALGVIIPIGSMSVLLTDCNETRYLSTHHKLFEVQHKNMYSCRWNFAYLHSTRRYWSVVPTDCNETRYWWTHHKLIEVQHKNIYSCCWISVCLHSTGSSKCGVKNRNVM